MIILSLVIISIFKNFIYLITLEENCKCIFESNVKILLFLVFLTDLVVKNAYK